MNRQDFYRLARNRIKITTGAKLLASVVDAVGSTVNVLINASSAMAEELESRSAARFAALFVATATDADLDRLVLERTFGRLPRKGAAAASFAVNLSRTAAGGGLAGTVPAGTEVIAGGLTWTLDNAVIFLAGQLGPLPITMACATLGSAGNLGPDSLGTFKNPGLLFDATLSVSKATAGSFATEPPGNYSTGGADQESDADYRARYALYDAGLDRNLDYLAAGAKSVGGVLYAVAIEDIDAAGSPTGGATLYVGDVNGRANAALLSRVRAAIRAFRLTGQRVTIAGTVPAMQTIVLSFAVSSAYSIASVQDAARAAVVTYVNALAPGASLTLASLAAVLAGVPGVVFTGSYSYGVITPGADVAAGTTATIIRTTSALVSFA
jgi:uncharacterized phage protein gp47/JayE